MPNFEHPDDFGDLFVEYNVVLPASLTPETKRRLADAFHVRTTTTKDEL